MTPAAVLFCVLSVLQAPPMQRGIVVNDGGEPVAGAVVTVKGTLQIAVTDDTGHFSIALTSTPATVVVAMPGFESESVTIAAVSDGLVSIALKPTRLTYQVVVRAPAPETPRDDRWTLRPLDVVRTAGTQADAMRALAVLPGVVQVDEGAGLFVRGGDVSETTVLLDGVVINHPYQYETPSGGFRGAVDPFQTQGVTFSTGGFASPFGDSLSGIVDFHGLPRPSSSHATFTAGLAGVSAQFAEPLGSQSGVRFAFNRATPGLLFAVNPSPQPFDQLPGGWDFSGGGYFDSNRFGHVHVFAVDQANHVGVQLDQDAFTGFLHSSAGHHVVGATWTSPRPGPWTWTIAAGTDLYTDRTDVGVFAVDERDRETSWRAEVQHRGNVWTVEAGTDGAASGTGATGEVPTVGRDFAGVGGTKVYDVAHQSWHDGAFIDCVRTMGRLTLTGGGRVDAFATLSATTFDPRLSAVVDLRTIGRLRFAWGIYHQSPSPAYFDLVGGALTLSPMSATHYIVGFERGQPAGDAFVRVEAYAKTYSQLPVQDDALGFASTGYGWAHGVDFFARRVWHFIDIRGSLSLLSTRRRWTSSDQQDRYALPDGTWRPDFDVPYSADLVVNAPISRSVAIATTWRTAGGRPFTPAIGAIPAATGYEPIWGVINSERLPRYARFDLALTYQRRIGSATSAVFFLSVDNLTNRQNFFSYAYSADYTVRRPVPGAAPRGIYVGVSITR